jgi:hemolysin-activating ACP:hemolysin acyltransferase
MFFKKNPPEAPPVPGPAMPPGAAAATPLPMPAAAAAAKPGLAPEDIKKRAAAAKHVAASFGEIVTLLMRSAADKTVTLQDLEWMVVPGLLSGQFAVADAQSKETGAVMPVGAVLWAFVSAEVDQRLSGSLEQNVRLQPTEWRSGDIPWIVLAIGDPNVLGGLLQQLSGTVFAKQAPKMRARGADGKVTIGRLEFNGKPTS